MCGLRVRHMTVRVLHESLVGFTHVSCGRAQVSSHFSIAAVLFVGPLTRSSTSTTVKETMATGFSPRLLTAKARDGRTNEGSHTLRAMNTTCVRFFVSQQRGAPSIRCRLSLCPLPCSDIFSRRRPRSQARLSGDLHGGDISEQSGRE